MTTLNIPELQEQYRAELFDNVIPFWLRYSHDRVNGGFFSCLDRDGYVYDTDKFSWMQGRQIWMLSKLCEVYGTRESWLSTAAHGLRFMREHSYAENGDIYFSMTREGKPLVSPYNVISECFMALACGAYARVSGDGWARAEALRLYRRVQERGLSARSLHRMPRLDTRVFLQMNLPMFQLTLGRELRGIVPEDELTRSTDEALAQITEKHIDWKLQQMFDHVLPDGGHLFEVMEGRLLNPGRSLETLRLATEAYHARGDDAMVEKLAEVMLWVLRATWDEECGGIWCYRDYKGLPTETLEANQRHWWVHCEALSATLLAHRLTGSEEHAAWFKRVNDYTFAHFPDPEYGEWFGYLSRDGKPELTLKGGKWKTCYHLPRALMTCERIMNDMA